MIARRVGLSKDELFDWVLAFYEQVTTHVVVRQHVGQDYESTTMLAAEYLATSAASR